MARVKTIKAQPKRIEAWKSEVCDNCSFGKWCNIEWNLDITDGKPLTIRCPFYKDGKVGIIRGTQACFRFNKKTCDAYLF